MILTPASTRRSATAWAAAAGTARTPTTTSCSETTCSSSAEVAHRQAPDLVPDQVGIDVEHRDDPEPVVGEDVGAGDRLAEVAGAEEGDVVLAGGAQDLADLGDQRVDVVADAPLAELAEAGQVAADLGRVDVRVVGEFLRGDRLPAHLPGLGEDLQVARQARRDAQRKSLAVDHQAVRHASISSIARSIYPTVSSRARSASASRPQLGDDLPVHLDDGDPLQHPPQQQLVALDVDLPQLELVALGVHRGDCGDRHLAEVTARPRIHSHVTRSRIKPRSLVDLVGRRRRRGSPGTRSRGEAGGGADHRGVVGAELQRDELELDAVLLAERRRRLAEGAVGGDAAAERDRRPVARPQRPLELRRQLPDRRRLEARREVGAAPLDTRRRRGPGRGRRARS